MLHAVRLTGPNAESLFAPAIKRAFAERPPRLQARRSRVVTDPLRLRGKHLVKPAILPHPFRGRRPASSRPVPSVFDPCSIRGQAFQLDRIRRRGNAPAATLRQATSQAGKSSPPVPWLPHHQLAPHSIPGRIELTNRLHVHYDLHIDDPREGTPPP